MTQASRQLPYRMALAGGWIDKPFVSRLNSDPPGSMVVVSIEPTIEFLERAGMAAGTRRVMRQIWGDAIPARDRASLVRELYNAENTTLPEPSGSQDMIGLIYPGVSRLDYDGGVFPSHIESCVDPSVARWLESVIHVIPVGPRPDGYAPLTKQNLDPSTIAELGRTGRDCYDAILSRDARALGDSMNRCMTCWQSLLPHTVRHPTLTHDLIALLREHQQRSLGAMYSGCGGGYLYVVSEDPVRESFNVQVRLS